MGVKITDFATLEDAVKEIEQQEVEIRSLEEKIKRLVKENEDLDFENDQFQEQVSELEDKVEDLEQDLTSMEEDMVKKNIEVNTGRSVIQIGIDNGNLMDVQLCEAFRDLLESNVQPLLILEKLKP